MSATPEKFASAYIAQIQSVTTAEEQADIDQAIKLGRGNEHDLLDANDQVRAAFKEVFGFGFFASPAPTSADIAIVNRGISIAHEKGFSK